uniref:Uncharacterized protein n=1 Tax=Cannabis sativa TaxID=3483 RepID=A0A803QT13_CANSA
MPTIERSPLAAALYKAVRPSRLLASLSAPDSTNTRVHLICPLATATCRGVLPSLSTQFNEPDPLPLTKSKTSSARSNDAATCNSSQPLLAHLESTPREFASSSSKTSVAPIFNPESRSKFTIPSGSANSVATRRIDSDSLAENPANTDFCRLIKFLAASQSPRETARRRRTGPTNATLSLWS